MFVDQCYLVEVFWNSDLHLFYILIFIWKLPLKINIFSLRTENYNILASNDLTCKQQVKGFCIWNKLKINDEFKLLLFVNLFLGFYWEVIPKSSLIKIKLKLSFILIFIFFNNHFVIWIFLFWLKKLCQMFRLQWNHISISFAIAHQIFIVPIKVNLITLLKLHFIIDDYEIFIVFYLSH